MVRNKNLCSITMVNPEQIAKMKYRGCSTTQAVKNFCTRFKVNRIWWKPQATSKRILLIDLQNFRSCWSTAYGKNLKVQPVASSRCKTSPVKRTTVKASKRGVKPPTRTRTGFYKSTSTKVKVRRAA